MFVDMVNERAKGELIIQHIGSREVLPMFEMATAVKRGVIQMAFVRHGVYAGMVPAAAVVYASRLTLAEEQERGVIDLLREIHAEAGFYYLGRPRDYDPEGLFFINSKEKFEKPEDLVGKKIAHNGTTNIPFVKALGAIPVVLSGGDIFGAVERGIVDAYASPLTALVAAGVHEIVNYSIDHGHYNDGLAYLIGLEYWNTLPQHLQELLAGVMKDLQKEGLARRLEDAAFSRQATLDAGVEFIKFSPADAERFIELAYSSYWEDVIKKNPELGPRFFEIMEK